MGNFISWIKENMGEDENQGSAQEEKAPPSLSGMISTLVPVLIISLVYIVLFLILRRSHRRFYAPRTYLGSLREEERSPELPGGWFNWFGAFWKIPDAYALQHQGLDAYLFLRYLRMCMVMTFVCACITWPILFPINATGGNGAKELELLSYSNIKIQDSTERNRLYAHTFVGWIVYSFIMYMITRECIFYINLRQAFLLNPQYAQRISSRTVLFTCVPKEYLNEARIRQLFTGAIKNVWIAGETKKLEELVEERDKVAMKLEKAEVKLLKTVNKERVKAEKGGKTSEKTVSPRDTETGNIASRYIPDKKRPHHRLGPLGLIGKKVDTIAWGRSELQRLIPEAQAAQTDYLSGKYAQVSAVFVEFHNQSDAQAALQVTTHHHALQMSPRYIGVKPSDVVWKSLNIPWWQLVVRRYVVYAIIAALVIFWAIPVGIVGIIAQVNTLKKLPGLTWIGDIPQIILGVVSGLLPAVALAILMSLVPVFMRALARLAGCTNLAQVELFTQNAYFFFQVVQVFLIQTLANTASTAIVQIAQSPTKVFDVLSASLPTASNFYISYFIVQGLTIATSVLTQVVGCVIFGLLYKFLTGTPRAMYNKWTSLSAILWGSLLPVYTNIVVISVTYAVIAPLILFWSTIALGLFYLAYRYNLLFVSDTAVDTQGLFYPRALKQLFVGIYLAEICMVGMFAISKAIGPCILMAVFLVFTILYQMSLGKALNPLLYTLPRTLQIEEELHQESLSAAESADGVDGAAHNGVHNGAVNGANGATDDVVKTKGIKKFAPGGNEVGVQKQGNFLAKFLKPWIYADYWTLRKLVPQSDTLPTYDEATENNAYWPPSATSETPVLWIPEDIAGVSKQEIAETSRVIPITDEGSRLDEKNKLVWDTEGARPPIWSEKVYY